MINKAAEKAIKVVGSQKKLGIACGVTQACVWKWLHGVTKVSPSKVPLIVKATGGKVKAYEIRPDLPALFPHPKG